MATLVEIAFKGEQLAKELRTLQSLKDDKQAAQDRVQEANAAIDAQQLVVEALKTELKGMI